MPKYPTEITDAVLVQNKHITDSEMERDIAETEAEIAHLDHVWEAERILAQHSLDANERKLADFKASARPYQINERREFIAFLKRIQEARARNSTTETAAS